MDRKQAIEYLRKELNCHNRINADCEKSDYGWCDSCQNYIRREKFYQALQVVVDTEKENRMINKVTVRWWDGYLETFEATEVRFGCDLLWMRLENGSNRHIPLRQVRWYSTSIESHEPERRTDET